MPSVVTRATVADGTELLVRHWPDDDAAAGGAWAGPAWASVLLVHGIAEHSGRYEHVGEQMAAAGLDVWAYDQRGNGDSGGRRGHVDRWSQLHDDLGERLAVMRTQAGARPSVLYGHSLGGLIVAGYLLSDRPKPDLAILTSPALDATLPAWKAATARVLGGLAPTFAVKNDFDGTVLSHDPAVGRAYEVDPLRTRVTTARFGAEALTEQARVRALATRGFGIPTLVVHGEGDRLVPVGASAVLQGAPGVDRRTYPGLFHELHNEREGRTIIDDVIAWLRSHVPA
jgi:acylglycerol lipase